ncbi:MAG: PaaI family thioesterase [Deltaproteobacteria bacterium]|nr:PaaI family thioesterase [Deltaproteobacteria bacterium]
MTESVKIPSAFERLKSLLAQGYRPPVAKLLDFQAAVPEPDQAVVTLRVDERLHSPMGTLHGGILCDIADSAMGIAFSTGLGEGESFATLELKLNFFKPVFQGILTAEAKVLRRGTTVGMILCTIYDEKRSLVAHANSSVMILRGEKAENRHFQELRSGDSLENPG